MNELLVGYARVSTEQQDLTTQRDGLHALGVGGDRIYVDHGLTARTGTGQVFGWRSPPVERATPSCDAGPAHPLAARCPRLCRGRAAPGGAWPGLASASAALPRSDNPAQGLGPPSTKRDRIVSVDDDLLSNEIHVAHSAWSVSPADRLTGVSQVESLTIFVETLR